MPASRSRRSILRYRFRNSGSGTAGRWVPAGSAAISRQRKSQSLPPKSITTAIALGMTEELGGVAAVTVMSVFLTGILGAVIAGTVFKLFHIEDPVAQGLAMGTASHAIGTSKALEMGEIQAAMSSLAIAVTGIFTVIIGPIIAGLY